jgi:hypothetical protein
MPMLQHFVGALLWWASINAAGGVGMFRCNDHGGGIGHCRGGVVLCLHTWVSVGVVPNPFFVGRIHSTGVCLCGVSVVTLNTPRQLSV